MIFSIGTFVVVQGLHILYQELKYSSVQTERARKVFFNIPIDLQVFFSVKRENVQYKKSIARVVLLSAVTKTLLVGLEILFVEFLTSREVSLKLLYEETITSQNISYIWSLVNTSCLKHLYQRPNWVIFLFSALDRNQPGTEANVGSLFICTWH